MPWGDAWLRHVSCDKHDFRPAALFDFELAAWLPVQLDVTRLAEIDGMRTLGSNPGYAARFLEDDAAVNCYEHHAGRRLLAGVARATTFNVKVGV